MLNQRNHRTYAGLLNRLKALPSQDRLQLLEELPDDSELKTLLCRKAPWEKAPVAATLLTTLAAVDQTQPATLLFGSVQAGQMIGSYQLIRELGRGGMGVVYLAEKADGHPKREVALKLPKPDFDVHQFLERFGREREILAGLNHPNIARLYDAGLSNGQPFLVLEYVNGQSIVDYCNRQTFSVDARIHLFLQVLDALQYAHSRLVIHRDLKPGNIFVTAEGQAKLLDFGTAKLLVGNEELSDITAVGVFALTPNYASPEQLVGEAVSIATDIYSLGVVLFELLAGERPFQRNRPLGSHVPEECPLLSSVIVDRPRATLRGTTPKKLRQVLRGDLSSIVAKALHPVPQDRYATAEAFADDLRRYITGRPIRAASRTLWYRTGKFVGRHKLSVALTAAGLLGVVIALCVTLWALREARSETRRSQASERFLEDLFTANSQDGADPVKARQTTARELLDIAARKIDSELRDVPKAKLAVLSTLKRMYQDLGLE